MIYEIDVPQYEITFSAFQYKIILIGHDKRYTLFKPYHLTFSDRAISILLYEYMYNNCIYIVLIIITVLNATSEKSYGKLLCSWLIMHVNLKHIYSWPYWYSLTQYIGKNILFFMLWTKDIVLLPATKLAYNKKHFAYFGFKHLLHVSSNEASWFISFKITA